MADTNKKQASTTPGMDPIAGVSAPKTQNNISDLGDILLDKSLDAVEQNDFKPVSAKDVHEIDGTTPETKQASSPNRSGIYDDEGEENIVANTDINANTDTSLETQEHDDVDLGEIDLGNDEPSTKQEETTPAVEPTIEPTVEPISEPVIEANAEETTPVAAPVAEPEITIDPIVVDEISTENNTKTTEEIIKPEETTPVVETTVEPVIEAKQEEATPAVEPTIEPASEPLTDIIAEDVQPEKAKEEIPAVQPEITIQNPNSATDAVAEPMDIITNIEEIAGENNATTTNNETQTTPVEEITPVAAPIAEPTVETTAEPAIVETPKEVKITEPVTQQAPGIEIDSIMSDDTEAAESAKPRRTFVPQDDVTQPVAPTEAPTAAPTFIPTSEVMAPTGDAPKEAPTAEKLANLENVAQQLSEGIDLDSLMNGDSKPETPKEVMPKTTENKPTGTIPTPPTAPTSVAKKPVSKPVLIGLGVVALAGIAYFGYLSFGSTPEPSTVSLIKPRLTGNVAANSGLNTTGMQATGFIATGDATTGQTTSGTTTSGLALDTTGISMPTNLVPSRMDLIAAGQQLASAVKKLLIKATINKNGSAKIQAFDLQKDIDTFTQTLENSTDITTVSDSKKLTDLSQRLATLTQKLNGTTNQ